MRRLRYQVACTLDGFIAGPNGEYDWIVADPAIDFDALYAEFDTAVMGRKTFDVHVAQGGDGSLNDLAVVVCSRTIDPARWPAVRVISGDPVPVVQEMKDARGKDIWLYGGGELFRTMLDAGLVDTVEVAVMPVLIGAGIPLLPRGAAAKLELIDTRTTGSGLVMLSYRSTHSPMPGAPITYVKTSRR